MDKQQPEKKNMMKEKKKRVKPWITKQKLVEYN